MALTLANAVNIFVQHLSGAQERLALHFDTSNIQASVSFPNCCTYAFFIPGYPVL
jgi:hypothetical protein